MVARSRFCCLKHRKTNLIIAVVAFLLLSLAFVFPVSKPDLASVHPFFRTLQEPIRVTAVRFYLDGGSIELKMVDATGSTNIFALPVSSTPETDRYSYFVCSSVKAARTNNQERTPLDAKTRAYISYLIEHRAPRGSDANIVLTSLRGAPRDYASLMIEILRDRLSKK